MANGAARASNISEVTKVAHGLEASGLNKKQTAAIMEVAELARANPEVLNAIGDFRRDMDVRFVTVDSKFATVDSKFDKLWLQLTATLGGIMVAGISVLGVVLGIVLKAPAVAH